MAWTREDSVDVVSLSDVVVVAVAAEDGVGERERGFLINYLGLVCSLLKKLELWFQLIFYFFSSLSFYFI